MSRSIARFSAAIFALAAVTTCPFAEAQDLEAGFRHPPHRAGIRCFWWWLNSNVTEDAITRDLEEMKAKGYSGALIFDADGSSQHGNRRAPAGPLFGGPEWTKLFVHACREAKRLDLELDLNLQSGWNLGGPKVRAEEATQRLVWSKTTVKGLAPIEQRLLVPRHSDFYRDVAVIAVPIPDAQGDAKTKAGTKTKCVLRASSSQPDFPAALAMDGTRDTFWVSQDRPAPDRPQWLLLTFSEMVDVSELSLQGRRGYGPREGKIQVSSDNKSGTPVCKCF